VAQCARLCSSAPGSPDVMKTPQTFSLCFALAAGVDGR
jgi:hypothetical protein